MGLGVSAFRTDAQAARTGRPRSAATAHSITRSAAHSTSASTQSRSSSSSIDHGIHLLKISAPAIPLSPVPASRHGINRSIKLSPHPSPDDRCEVAGNERHDLDARSRKAVMEKARNRAADKDFSPKARQRPGFFFRTRRRKNMTRFPDDPPIVDFDDQNILRNIEDRGYPVVPSGERGDRFHLFSA